MSEPLDDFNRRMSGGDASWMQGPATNAAESAGQSFADARSRLAVPGGGSIDFGARISAVILLVGIALFGLGAYVVDHMTGGAAMTGILVLIVSGFFMLIGGGGLAVDSIRSLGSPRCYRRLFLAALAGFAAWYFSSWLWMATLAFVPKGLIPVAAVALVFVFMPPRRA